MIYGYARVSTKGQAKDGNSLEAQERILLESGVRTLYVDRFTGNRMDRPQFQEMMKELAEGDTLMVTKLDRMARSLFEGGKLVDSLIRRGVRVHILNIGVLDDTPASKLIRNIFFAFAEFERDMLIERTQEGKAIARAKEGFREGRPKKFTQAQLDHALQLLENHSYPQVEKMVKISKSTLLRAKRAALEKDGV